MAIRMTFDELKALGVKIPGATRKKKSKYNAKKTWVDGISFDSKAEAEFYCELKLMVKCKKIAGFCRQPRFVITEGKNGNRGVEYVSDFVIFNNDGTYKIVDVKGVETSVFKLKIKGLREKYPKIKVEVRK